MSIILRPYQVDIVNETRVLMQKGHKSILICSPTGSGKTALTSMMMLSAAAKKMPCIFGVHRRELVKQSVMALDKADVFHGIIAAGFPEDARAYAQVGSIPSIGRRIKKVKVPHLMIWDECHHVAAGTWSKIFNTYPNAYHIGLTATPERLDGKGLSEWFKVMVKVRLLNGS